MSARQLYYFASTECNSALSDIQFCAIGRRTMTFKRAKKKSNKPLTREEELLLEIESLRCKNALLKKINALVQAEEIKKIKRNP